MAPVAMVLRLGGVPTPSPRALRVLGPARPRGGRLVDGVLVAWVIFLDRWLK